MNILTVRPLSRCCEGAPLGLDEQAKKLNPRGKYFGCMSCGEYLDRWDAAHEIRVLRRSLREIGYTNLRRPRQAVQLPQGLSLAEKIRRWYQKAASTNKN